MHYQGQQILTITHQLIRQLVVVEYYKMEQRIENIEQDIAKIKENHLSHIEIDLAKTSVNVDWLMKFFWIVASASIGSLITGIITLLK